MAAKRVDDTAQLALFELPTHADELADARAEKGLSLHALARVTGVDVANLSRIERGHQRASAATMRAIRQAQRELTEEAAALAQLAIEAGTKAHLRDVVRWEHDDVARYAVAALGAMPVWQIADVLDLCETTIDETLASALAKLRSVDGLEAFAELVREVRTERDARGNRDELLPGEHDGD